MTRPTYGKPTICLVFMRQMIVCLLHLLVIRIYILICVYPMFIIDFVPIENSDVSINLIIHFNYNILFLIVWKSLLSFL